MPTGWRKYALDSQGVVTQSVPDRRSGARAGRVVQWQEVIRQRGAATVETQRGNSRVHVNARVWSRSISVCFPQDALRTSLTLLFEDCLHVQQQIPSPVSKPCLNLSLSPSCHQRGEKKNHKAFIKITQEQQCFEIKL